MVALSTYADGAAVVGPDPTRLELAVDLGDDAALESARAGRAWVGDVDDRGDRSLAAAVPVLADDGEVLGAVVITEAYPSLAARAERAVPDLVVFLALGLALGGLGSWGLSRLIRRRTRGLEPAEIGALADQSEALLHSIREGLVAVDDDGALTVVNDTARSLLQGARVEPGTRVADAGLPPEIADLLGPDDREVHDAVLVHGGRVLVANRTRVRGGGVTGGVVVTLRDHTELLALRSELRERESVTETLRAQTHEFSNQLHTVSGLLQLQEYDEAAAAIGTIVRRRAEISDGVRARIEDPQVAALLVAKTSVAAERGQRVEVVNTEPLPRLDPDLAGDVVTVLGNLIDNAVDAMGAEPGTGEVRVDLRLVDDTVHVRVADTGPGIDADETDLIFTRGWSTKPSGPGGRGVGLALVRQICQRRGGDVVAAPNRSGAAATGAVFDARLPARPPARLLARLPARPAAASREGEEVR